MGSREKPLFDLNEPAVEDDDTDSAFCFKPQKAVSTSKLSPTSSTPHRTVNSHAFSHVSSVSGFQPFIRSKGKQASEVGEDQKRETDTGSVIEKEEGEWSDAEGSADINSSSSVPEMSTSGYDEKSQVKVIKEFTDQHDSNVDAVVKKFSKVDDVKNESRNNAFLGLDADLNDRKSSCSRNSEGDIAMYKQEDSVLAPKRKEIRGAEATHALRLATNLGKRPKIDQQKEAMLGKKRSRQTMFLNLEDVKQVGPSKISTPRRQNILPPVTTRVVKESGPLLDSSERSGEKQFQQTTLKDAKQVDQSCNEENSCVESGDTKSECNGDMNSGSITRSRRTNNGTNLAADDKLVSDHRQMKNPRVPIKKPPLIGQNPVDSKAGVKKLPSRKPPTVTTQYQDTSVERLLREVTNENFWQHPGPRIAKGIPAASCGGRSTFTTASCNEL